MLTNFNPVKQLYAYKFTSPTTTVFLEDKEMRRNWHFKTPYLYSFPYILQQSTCTAGRRCILWQAFFSRFCHWAELVSLKVQLCSKQINTVGLPVFPQNGPTFDITTTMSESTLLLFSFALTAFLMAPNVVFGQLPNGRSLPPIEGKLK